MKLMQLKRKKLRQRKQLKMPIKNHLMKILKMKFQKMSKENVLNKLKLLNSEKRTQKLPMLWNSNNKKMRKINNLINLNPKKLQSMRNHGTIELILTNTEF